MNEKHPRPQMNYENYSVEDFASDQDFVHWVKKPQPQNSLFWKKWLKEHPHKRLVIEEARSLVQSIEFGAHPDAQRISQNVWERIKASNRQRPAHESARPVRTFSLRRVQRMTGAIAAMLLVATVLSYMFWRQPVTYQTSFGETRHIDLPDGSVVVLNANSALTLSDTWKQNREVWLEGEAFFSIQRRTNPADPSQRLKFTVHTNMLDVKVLGTEFTVSERGKTTVVLNTGAIELSLDDKKIAMKPGDLVEVSAKKELKHHTVNPKVYSAWKDHEWILDGLSLEQIAVRIKDTYGLTVVVKNKPREDIEITGEVPTENLETLLQALSTVFDRRVMRQGDEVLIE